MLNSPQNNADEGASFVPRNIVTEDDLLAFIRVTFPLFSASDISKLLYYYPGTNASVSPNATLFSTPGDVLGAPNAINQSAVATGQQQRAEAVYSESVITCPSYWLASSQAQRGKGHAAYKYQYSVPPATHAQDFSGYFGPLGTTPTQSVDFQLAFMAMLGNLVMNNDPSISALVANGNSTGNTTGGNPAETWPQYDNINHSMLNMNETGGTPESIVFPFSTSANGNVTQDVGPGLSNQFEVVDGYTWEANRGARCEFWLGMAAKVPE